MLSIPGPFPCPEVGAAVYIRLAEDILTPQSVQETCPSQAQFKAWLSLNTQAKKINLVSSAITSGKTSRANKGKLLIFFGIIKLLHIA